MKRIVCFGFCELMLLSSLALSQGWAIEQRPWDAENEFGIKRFNSLEVSLDGTHLLFVLSETSVDENQRYSSIWTLPIAGGESKPLTDRKSRVSNPRWSPDGSQIAYFSSGQQGLGLWVMERDGSRKRRLTHVERSNTYIGMRGNRLAWSPDGKTLAYNGAGPRHYRNTLSPLNPPAGNDVMVIDRLLYKATYYYSDLRRTYVWTISSDGGEPRPVSFGDFDSHSISWSSDGKHIVCVSNRTGRDDFNSNNDVVVLSTEGKSSIQLTHTIGPEYTPAYSPDGTRIAFLGRLRDKRSKESDAEFPKIYVMPSTGGQARSLTSNLDMSCRRPAWAPDGSKVYFLADNSGKSSLFSTSLQNGEVKPLIQEKGQVTQFAVGKQGEILFVYTDFTHPEEIYRTNAGQDGMQKLTAFNEDRFKQVAITEPERFTFPTFDGLDIEGWMIKPYGFKEGNKYPMILDVHGGPHGQYGYNLSRTAKLQLYAARGYVVVFLNPRGSTGYGQKFSDLCVGDLGGGDYKDLMLGVDYALRQYPFIDSERLGVTGVSYGGYMANWITTHTDRFKASIPISGISNLISGWGINANGQWFETDMGFTPFDDYERAWDASPLKYVKKCKTPTLFINGAWDNVTGVNQAEEMFMALKKLGVDTVMAIYPNEGHGVRRQPQHTLDYYRRTVQWFDKYLK